MELSNSSCMGFDQILLAISLLYKLFLSPPSPTSSPLPYGHIIHGPSVRYLLEPRVNPTRSSMGTSPHFPINGNFASYLDITLLALLHYWVFSRIICVGLFGLLYLHYVRDLEHLATTFTTHYLSFDTTSWGDNILGSFQLNS